MKLKAVEDKLEEVHRNNRVMEGRIAAIEGDIKEMKEMLAQVLSHTKVNK